jgi:hypothetical protein
MLTGSKTQYDYFSYGDRPSGTSRREDLQKGARPEIKSLQNCFTYFPGSGISAVQDVIMITLA